MSSKQQSNSIEINLNGKKEKFPQDISVRSLLNHKGINPNVVACELNLKIIKRVKLDETVLKEGDTLEIIQMIGGG